MSASRHLIQALLVRRLLWAGISKDGIADIIANLTEEETHRALTNGMNFTAREVSRNENDEAPQHRTEAWTRILLAPGIELHCRKGRGKLRPEELPKLLRRVETWLKREVG